MSARYSNSPRLRLPIAESRICSRWQGALVLSLVLSLVVLATRGYCLLSGCLLALVVSQVPALLRQPMAGTVVHWYCGQWRVERGGELCLVNLHPSSRVSPLGIYLSWAGSGGVRESVWLFADSAPPQALRRLRVRLTLAG